ncbi:MAG: preprotein translocase subunit SecA, partial [Chlamydiae bacterium]|nr:preprotein translocase subunit SecA [Chlamydiota bacterium]
QRLDADDEIYMTEREKYNAILKEIKEVHEKGRPILIGTESVEVSEKLSRILKQNKLEHTILNAKNHAKEAEVIAEAGKKGSITLATNMAGRGTDIKLKGEVASLGGLHVIGTTRHQSRRTDRQLRGRSGRLGDPGSSKFFVSFEDSLMRLFSSPRMTSLLQRFRPPEGEAISAKILNQSIETAQKRVEQRNYTIRKHTLEYDDVMNRQRQEVYAFRNDLLSAEDPIKMAEDLFYASCAQLAEHSQVNQAQNKKDPIEEYRNALMAHFPVHFEDNFFADSSEDLAAKAASHILATFELKLKRQRQILSLMRPDLADEEKMQKLLGEVIRNVMIRRIDQLWQEHLLSIDHLRSDVHMRTVGQKDPLVEFKHESFALFEAFSQRLKEDITRDLFRFEMIPPEAQEKLRQMPTESLLNLRPKEKTETR